MAYLPDGSLDTHTDFEGQTTKTTYDEQGRLDIVEYYPTGVAPGSVSPGDFTDFEYGTQLRLESITEPGRLTTFGYDTFGRLETVAAPEGVIHYGYNASTGVQDHTWTDNTDVAYDYDNLGQLSSLTMVERGGVTLSEPEGTTYTYDLLGNVDLVTRPNGVISDYDYDGLGRLEELTTRTAGGAVLSQFVYQRDAAGRIKHVNETVKQPSGGTVTAVVDYVYDSIGRLTREDRDSSDDAQDFVTDYVLDLVGNRLQKTTQRSANTEIVDYIYNALDQLTDESASLNGLAEYAVEYGYDLNGSQTSRVRTGGGAETVTSDYNLRGRMTSVDVSRADGSATHAEYSYDHEGIRVSVATTNTPAGGGSATGDVRTFLNDAQNPTGYVQALEEYVSTGGGAPTLDVTYTLGRVVESQYRAGEASAYIYDGHSGVRQVTSQVGLVTDSYTYDGFGVLVAGFGTTDNQHRYRGEYQDLVTGDVYLRARWLTTQLGRFDTVDPAKGLRDNPQSYSAYSYGVNDPLNHVDPLGLFSLTEVIGTQTIGQRLQTFSSVAAFSTLVGAADAALDPNATGQSIAEGAFNGLQFGLALGAGGAIAPGIVFSGEVIGLFSSLGAVSAIDAFSNGNLAQGVFRSLLAGVGFSAAGKSRSLSEIFRPARSAAYAGPAAEAAAEQAAARALEQLEVVNGPTAHFQTRHGAQTTIEQQYNRATTGARPDGSAGMPTNASRFFSHRIALEMYNRAVTIRSQQGGGNSVIFDAGRLVGEGFTRAGSELRWTSNVQAFFDAAGNLITMYPLLSPLP